MTEKLTDSGQLSNTSQSNTSQSDTSQSNTHQTAVKGEDSSKQTVGQMERAISQKMQALYKRHLGHQPNKVTCQLFDSKMAIILEGSITQPEQLLLEEGKTDLAEKVREDLSQAIEPQIRGLIEEVLDVQVLDLLSDATVDTARTGIIAVLSGTPSVRNPEAIPKVKK